VAALVACALLVVGCGGPLSKRDYERRVDQLSTHAQQQLRGAIDGNSPPSGAQLRRAGTVFAHTADDLDSIHPPSRVAKAHGQLVDGFRRLGAAFGRYADDLAEARSDGDRAKVFVRLADDRDVRRAFDDLTAAQRAFRSAGYSRVLGPDDGGATARSGTAPGAGSTTATSATTTG
jgi:hypothetical protein